MPPSEGSFARVLFLSLTAAIGGFLFGFDSGVINGAVEALQVAFNASAIDTGFNVASMLIGCAVGAFFAGTFADRFGRKPVMMVTAIAFLISAIGSGIANSSMEFVMYRVLGGLAVGAASVLAPAYISEVSPPSIRGSLASLQQLMIVLGLFMAFLSNYLIANAAGGASANWLFGFPAWRWMFWIEVLPSVLFLVAIFCIPESPRYLVAVGRRDDAHKVIASISGHATAGGIVEEIVDSLKDCTKPRLRDVIEKHTGKVSRVVWVGIGLAALQQLVGINVVFYYSAVLWRAAGFSENDALLTTVISGVVNVVSTFVAIALVDRVGRKPLLLIGSIGMAVSLGALAVIFSTGQMVDGELKLGGAYGMAALFAANLYVVFFAFSWGPIMWVMLGEMFPNHLRGSALSICGFVQWMANFAVTLTFPMLLGSVGLGVSYGIYAFFAAVSVLFVVKAVRETKGMTLEQMKN